MRGHSVNPLPLFELDWLLSAALSEPVEPLLAESGVWPESSVGDNEDSAISGSAI